MPIMLVPASIIPAPASRFFLPNNRLWYSFNMGSVHFTVTSSEHDYTPGSPQHNWVLADLSSIDRSITPWIVFTSHRPLYTAACVSLPLQHACQIESPVFQALQVAWEDVLIANNVTLVATAHIHYYERTCAVAHGVCANASSHPASPHDTAAAAAAAASAAAQVKAQPAPSGAPIYVVVGPAGAAKHSCEAPAVLGAPCRLRREELNAALAFHSSSRRAAATLAVKHLC